MKTLTRVVDNRVFLLGLDFMYREETMEHERTELLGCARKVAALLNVEPANVPIEGYYTEHPQLTEYFRLIRALQNVNEKNGGAVTSLPEFQRLRDVFSSPIFGRATYRGKLLPVGEDPLSSALQDTFPKWTVTTLTAAAHKKAMESDDFSLVGLAARANDAVVLAATRESTVLYSMELGMALNPVSYEYVWKVDEDLARHAKRFIDTYNKLFGAQLPPPQPVQAERFWHASDDNKIYGRCVRLGYDDSTTPIRHYHWGIRSIGHNEYQVHEFWNPEIWTTQRYRSSPPRG